MAIAGTRNQGKSEFVRDVLTNDPYANARKVNEAWSASGREGKISDTLVNKMRSDMGLAGNLRGGRPRRSAAASATATAEKPKYTGKKRGRKPRVAAPVDHPAPSNGRSVVGTRGRAGGRPHQLATLEADLDHLLFKVMNLGDYPEVEDSLRKTRRLLYGALSGDRA